MTQKINPLLAANPFPSSFNVRSWLLMPRVLPQLLVLSPPQSLWSMGGQTILQLPSRALIPYLLGENIRNGIRDITMSSWGGPWYPLSSGFMKNKWEDASWWWISVCGGGVSHKNEWIKAGMCLWVFPFQKSVLHPKKWLNGLFKLHLEGEMRNTRQGRHVELNGWVCAAPSAWQDGGAGISLQIPIC